MSLAIMSQPELSQAEADFETQLASLVVEASRLQTDLDEESVTLEKKAAAAPAAAAPAPGITQHNVLQMLKPVVLGIEALGRAITENTSAVTRVEASLASQAGLEGLMGSVQEALEKKQLLNQKLFDSLYEELRGYKDGFLLEVLHKPVVRDLITLFDDLSSLHQQITNFLGQSESQPELTSREEATLEQTRIIGNNLDHIVHSVIEVMERLEVSRMDSTTGKLNKITQRAVAVETADTEDEDSQIARSVKPGFLWRDRVVRPELVVIKKWKDNYLVALPQNPHR